MRYKYGLLASFLLGMSHGLAATYFWAWYVPGNAIADWLSVSLGQRGFNVAFLIAIYLHDLLVGLLVAYPFAWGISKIKTGKGWTFLWVAFLGSTILLEWSLIADPEWLLAVLRMPSAYLAHTLMLIPLPLAYMVIAKIMSARSSPMVNTG